MITALAPAASSAPDEGHVEQPEQEQREQHPDLEPGVAAEGCALSWHGLKDSEGRADFSDG